MHTYVIGDIHGMLNKLEALLGKIPFRAEEDTLAFLGDYVDRGPDSVGVINLVLRLMDRGIRVVCLRGNHEKMFVDFLNNREPDIFLLNGGKATLESYRKVSRGGKIVIPNRHLSFLEGLLPYYEMEGHILVHAGLKPGVPLSEQEEADLYWIRYEFVDSGYDFGKKVIFGHTTGKLPYVDRFKIGIDTGAVYGNLLTCVRLPDVVFYSV